MIKYNDDNIYVGQIKQLLHEFNLPSCRVATENDSFYDGEYFIDREKNKLMQFVRQDTVNGNSIFKEICNYKLNDKILNITKNLELRNNYYDSYVHEYLGNYLRFIKDFCGLNLMSLYNCFSSRSPVALDVTINNVHFSSKSKGSVVYMIPVKSNTEYTLAVNASTVDIFFGHYDNGIIASNKMSDDYKKLKGLLFNKPRIIKTPELYHLNQRDTFKMFIKVSASTTESIVLLEGNHTKSVELHYDEYASHLSDIIFNYEDISETHPGIVDPYEFNTKNQLLELSTTTKYLLADRLLEYLSDNVITHLDSISNNIKKVQTLLANCRESPVHFDFYGLWSKNINDWIYRYVNTYRDARNCKFLDLHRDVLSYVDKDVESLLNTLTFSTQTASNVEKRLEEMGGDLYGI